MVETMEVTEAWTGSREPTTIKALNLEFRSFVRVCVCGVWICRRTSFCVVLSRVSCLSPLCLYRYRNPTTVVLSRLVVVVATHSKHGREQR